MRISRRAAIAGLATSPLLAAPPKEENWHALAEQVKAAMAWAWGQYREKAWGKDEFKPVNGTTSSFPIKDHHLGLSLIEALDTLWVMGLDAQFQDGVDWVKANADFDVDGEVSVFETSIRIVGGLLSAHHACGDKVLLEKAHDLAKRLIPAFDTPTGFPYRYINLKNGQRRDPITNPAEIGTYLPEWGTLAALTGDKRFHDVPRRAVVNLYARRSKRNLLATRISAETGAWLNSTATVGSYADSYYEYLWDSWQLFGDAEMKAMYDTCTAGILACQKVHTGGRLWIADVHFETGMIVSTEQDELAAFYGGLLGQGGALALGAELTESWAALQDRYGVLPEGYDFAADKPTQVTNALRPELADAAFNLWLLDRDPRWRQICAAHFRAMLRWNKAPYGFTDLADVTADPKQQADHCPGYWWSEQMKYYWLIFSDTPRFDYHRNYLSTEGNVLLGFRHR